jgi:hypothetical protein
MEDLLFTLRQMGCSVVDTALMGCCLELLGTFHNGGLIQVCKNNSFMNYFSSLQFCVARKEPRRHSG